MIRPSGRGKDEIRNIKIHRNYTKYAEGSVLIEYGDTKILCNASVTPGVPKFLKGKNQGWLTAEYSMLPRSTNERMQRDVNRLNVAARNMEIQRLISRSLRSAIDLKSLPEYTINIDCDVIQADGGTRTASITGGCVALYDAINNMQRKGMILSKQDPFREWVASVSVGIYNNEIILDLDYIEDSNAQTDFNIVMQGSGKFIEVQGTAEMQSFSMHELNAMLNLGEKGIKQLIAEQKNCFSKNY